ncbi:MAG: thiosulfate oxidation carrier protein SoxY [Gammaproteobacteria bacterium]|nr:thiosulfate oxidation carrier protein SoxY [Gammaproteobacteria bacterium]
MSMKRRTFLKGTLASSTVGVAVSAGLLSPQAVLAYPKDAFKNKEMSGALNDLLGMADTETSGDITVKAPDIAENGAVVPITVETSLPAESISLVVEKNPSPLVASFDLTDSASGYVSTRIKMGKSSDVIAVVKSGGKLYSGRKEVKVTIGGCGG